MTSSISIPSHVGGMIRSKKNFGLLCLIFIAALTLFLLREPKLPLPPPYDYHKPPIDSRPFPASSLSHPIHQLVSQAEKDHESLCARQSRTLEEAVAEYRRRYNLPPPPYFDKWYNFAKTRGIELIDEYDSIYNSLLPFWALDPIVIRERTREALGFDNALISVLIRNGKITKCEGGGDGYKWQRDATPLMMKNFIEYLPDMDLAFNIHDEPRVVMQHDDLAKHVNVALKEKAPIAFKKEKLKNSWSVRPRDMGDGDRIKEYKTTRFNRFAHQATWSNARLSCPLNSAARSCLDDACPDHSEAYTDLPLGFLQNTTAFSDICNSPSMERTFGFFDRPNAFDVVHELFPIFSQSKVSSFQDILYPSPWYFMGKVQYRKGRGYDIPWEEKASKMYWRGSTTGGFSRNGGWRRQHRQLFLTKIQPFGNASVLEYNDQSNPGMWHQKDIDKASTSDFFDVKFTFIGQCDPGDCDAQREYFGTVKPVNMFEAFGSKYLLDIDGNAFSGRYYAWLLSKSLVYKLAVFREWHDEWLKPWAHYIPLSLKGDEYVESVRYFEQEESGKVEAKRLAEASQNWAQRVLRNEDIEVWYFRLLLEYGRLIDDNRYDIGFSI